MVSVKVKGLELGNSVLVVPCSRRVLSGPAPFPPFFMTADTARLDKSRLSAASSVFVGSSLLGSWMQSDMSYSLASASVLLSLLASLPGQPDQRR